MAVRTINTLYRPNAVALLSSTLTQTAGATPLVAVAEGPQISLWDVRAAGRGGRVAKLSPGGPHAGHLFCMAASEDGAPPCFGAAGADRTVMVWDPRKWNVLDRWANCLKYEATSLHFSSLDPGQCLACGMDYEVICGRWGGDRRNRLGGGHRTGATTKNAIISGEDALGAGTKGNTTVAGTGEGNVKEGGLQPTAWGYRFEATPGGWGWRRWRGGMCWLGGRPRARCIVQSWEWCGDMVGHNK